LNDGKNVPGQMLEAYKLGIPKHEGGLVTQGGRITGTYPIGTATGGFAQIVPMPNGGFAVTTPQGTSEVVATVEEAKKKAEAKYDLQTVPSTGPNQPPRYSSRLDLLKGGAAGMSPTDTAGAAAAATQQQEVAKNYAKIYNDLQNASMANPGKIAKTQRIAGLLGDFEGGKLSNTGLEIARLGNSLGIKIDGKLPNKEAAVALANEVALELRGTGDGGGMPGAMSDADREFLKQMTPQLAQSADGRKLVVESRVKVMERQNKVAEMARAYRKKYGTLDEDFFNQLQGWSDRNPIFKVQ
jgi:hypothetical protein